MHHVRPDKADRISHSKGLNSIETAFAYVEQREVAIRCTTVQVLASPFHKEKEGDSEANTHY
jgi:hypothetical protein